jgi:predicted DNA-binding transcriptional regulator YafY
MSNVATRLLSLILLLQSRTSWKAGELAQELNVSERTVHRYMAMLDEMGIPIYSERGPYGGFSLVRGYKLPPLIFTAEEATVLYMGANLVREVWGRTYGDAVTAVTAKLDNVLPDDLRQQVDLAQQSLVVDGLTARDYRPWETTLHTLRQCIIARHCVELTYRAVGREKESCRIVEPYALTFQWGLWYLVGHCHLRDEIRTFRVDRIQQAREQERGFTMPVDFSVREHLARTLWVDPPYRVVIQLDACVATKVRDLHGHWMELVEQRDGSLLARFGVTHLDWAAGWALSYGAAARVIEPPELVTRVVEAARGALQQYAGRGIQGANAGTHAQATANRPAHPGA